MRKIQSGEAGVVDAGTMMQPPEQIYIATVTHPKDGKQIVTAHRSLQGAQGRVEEYASLWQGEDRDNVKGHIQQVPLTA